MNIVFIYPLYTIIGKIYKYVDMNIFVNFLLYLVVFYILYVIMEAEAKIFLNLLQFITTTFTIYDANVIVYYVTNLYLTLHLNF